MSHALRGVVDRLLIADVLTFETQVGYVMVAIAVVMAWVLQVGLSAHRTLTLPRPVTRLAVLVGAGFFAGLVLVASGFAVPEPTSGAARATLVVYDVLGQRVRTLVDGDVIAGEQAVTWDGATDAGGSAPSGVYIARLESGGSEQTIRILFVR